MSELGRNPTGYDRFARFLHSHQPPPPDDLGAVLESHNLADLLLNIHPQPPVATHKNLTQIDHHPSHDSSSANDLNNERPASSFMTTGEIQTRPHPSPRIKPSYGLASDIYRQIDSGLYCLTSSDPSLGFLSDQPQPGCNPIPPISQLGANQSAGVETEAIRKALSVLPPDTQHNLLMVLLATQASHNNQRNGLQTHSGGLSSQQAQSQLNDRLPNSNAHYGSSSCSNRPSPPPRAHSHSHDLEAHNLDHSAYISHSNSHYQGSQPTSPALTCRSSGRPFQSSRDTSTSEMTPILSPSSMTPLSTFSTAPFPNHFLTDGLVTPQTTQSSFQSSGGSMELFSPLTSPALRPQNHHEPHSRVGGQTIDNESAALQSVTQALINQAAALGLSTTNSFTGHDSLLARIEAVKDKHQNNQASSHPDPSTSTSPIFPANSMNVPNASAVSTASNTAHNAYLADTTIVQSPLLVPSPHLSTNQAIHSTAKPPHRQRSSRSNKSRASPHVRAVDQTPDLDIDGNGPSKRVRSVAGVGSIASETSPHALSKSTFTDSPSPIDLLSMDGVTPATGASATFSAPKTDKPSSSHASTASVLSLINGKRIRPLTPACIMNIDQPSTTQVFNSASRKTNHIQIVQSVNNNYPSPESSVDPSLCIHMLAKSQEPSTSSEASQLDLPAHDTKLTPNPLLVDSQGKSATNGSEASEKNSADALKPIPTTSDLILKKPIVNKRKNKLTANSTEPPEVRRSSHKVAEQRRRDSLKVCFEDLRQILPPIQWNQEEDQERRPGEGNVGGQRSVNTFDPLNPNKGISKVALLRRSNEYIIRLRERLERRDGAIEMLVKMIENRKDQKSEDQLQEILDKIADEKTEDQEDRKRLLMIEEEQEDE